MRTGRWSLAGQVFVLQLVLLALITALWAGYAVVHASRDSDRTAAREVTETAVSVAAAPSAAAVSSPDPTQLLQPVTEQIRQATGVDFIVVMAPDRTRFTMAEVGDPVLAALLLGKVNQAAERDIELTVTAHTALDTAAPLFSREAVTLVGNSIDAAAGGAWVEVTVRADAAVPTVRVAHSGPGLPPDSFAGAAERGYSTKTGHHGLGLALVRGLFTRHRGTIDTVTAPESAITVCIPREEHR